MRFVCLTHYNPSVFIFLFCGYGTMWNVEYDLCLLWFEHRGLNRSVPIFDRTNKVLFIVGK